MIAETQQQAHLARLREALSKSHMSLQETCWLGWNAAYRFRCPHGHEATRSGTHIIRFPIRCPVCHAQDKLAQLHKLAERAGGKCLSTAYLGPKSIYYFRCKRDHHFEARAAAVFAGRWCRRCAQLEHGQAMRDTHGLERLQKIASQRGGACLADHYTKQSDRYRFRCKSGHEWTTTGGEVLRGAWCALCARQKRSVAYRRKDGLEALRQIAQDHGGQCLSDAYLGSNARYRFCCASGHEWETSGASIFNGAWCLRCAHDQKRLSIETMRETASARGGRCISEVYVNTATKLEWECARGHRWWAIPGGVRKGHWCRECAILERITREKTRRLRRYEAAALDLAL